MNSSGFRSVQFIRPETPSDESHRRKREKAIAVVEVDSSCLETTIKECLKSPNSLDIRE